MRKKSQKLMTIGRLRYMMFAQEKVDAKGHCYLLFNETIDHKVDDTKANTQDVFIQNQSGTNHCREITKGWEILVQWKDISST